MTSPRPSSDAIQAWFRMAASARPFLRWAGGKGYALPQFSSMIPVFRGRYIEPFLGSGAVFFHVARERAGALESWLGDSNMQLIECFASVRDTPAEVSARLDALITTYLNAADPPKVYYELREQYNATLPRPEPALFLFLNRTCWNGLYRVNSRGEFNVPHGSSVRPPAFPTSDDLLKASAALTQARLRAIDWQGTIALAQPGDFVYLDPPYYSDVARDETKYSRSGFGLEAHRKLATAVKSLADRGVDFILTNSAEPEMRDLYESLELHIVEISVRRSISSDATTRSPASELVVRPHHLVEMDLTLDLSTGSNDTNTGSDLVKQLDLGTIRF